MTQPKMDIQKYFTPSIQEFYEDYYELIVDITGPELWEMYQRWCKSGQVSNKYQLDKKEFEAHRRRYAVGEQKDNPDSTGKNKKILVFNIRADTLASLIAAKN
jgi:hypothetical protein